MKLASHFNSGEMCSISVKWCFLQVWYNGTTIVRAPPVVHLMPSKENALLLPSSLNSTLLCKPRRPPLHSSHCLDVKETGKGKERVFPEALTRSALISLGGGCLFMQVERMARFQKTL